jgi:hypothetical protein
LQLLPRPAKVEKALRHYERPYLPAHYKMHWYERFKPSYLMFRHKKLRRFVHGNGIDRVIDFICRIFGWIIRMFCAIPGCFRRSVESKAAREKRLKKETGHSKHSDYRQFNRNKKLGLLKPKPKVVTSKKRPIFRGRRSRKVAPAAKVSKAKPSSTTVDESQSQVHHEQRDTAGLDREVKEGYRPSI